MGGCGSKPAVQEDVKPAAKAIPSAVDKPVQGPPASEPKAASTAQQPPPSAEDSAKRDVPPGRKSKSMELPPPSRPDVKFHSPQVREDGQDEEDSDEEENGGEWKVRRRVSRRLSLEVQKKPGSKTGSPSPGWGPTPTAEEKASWDAAADADLMGPVEVKTYAPAITEEEQGFQRGLHASAAGGYAQSHGAASEFSGSVGQSRLGPGFAASTVNDAGSDDESQGAVEMPGPWRAKRRGRRLSLEVEKAPDLALLAALRRSSSAPLEGEYARKAAEDDEAQERHERIVQQLQVRPPGSPSSRSSGESAVISPAAHSATVIDFAQKLSVDIGVDSNIEDEEDHTSTPPSVQIAEILAQGTPKGSPDKYRARRRKSRRLSLEIEKQPDEAVLAAVRRTYSAPVSNQAARAAMGEKEWASVLADKGGNEPYEPSAGRGANASDRATAGGDLVPAASKVATSAQEARANAWGSRNVIDFGQDAEDDDDDDDDDDGTAPRGSAAGDTGYVRVNPRGTSRRRSMDIYKKAVDSGASHDSAAQMARQYDPSFTSYESAAAEESDLLPLEDSGVTEFSAWSGTSAQPKSEYKKRFADYQDAEDEPESSSNRRFGGAYGNEPQPGAPSSLAGISV